MPVFKFLGCVFLQRAYSLRLYANNSNVILHGFSLKFKYTEVYKISISITFLLEVFFLTKDSNIVIYADSTKIH